ncbi:MAG: aldo/keto reductase [Microscillaceae bacterium]|jgi:predicted oxidoreductase|nr:aldo/keto reductase [Microscillaceae bacterium]
MKYISLFGSELKLSQIVYGVWRLLDDPEGFDNQRIERKIMTCLESGINTFDHADLYGGNYQIEGLFGKVLAEKPHLREQMVLVSKCGIQLLCPSRPQNYVKHYNTSREYIIYSAERSLQELHTDHLDILLIHRPDPLLRAEEAAEALNSLIQQGKIRYAGVSNFTNAQFELLDAYMDKPLITNQIELSLLRTSPILDGTLDMLQRLKINPMAWSPVGGGRLFTGTDAQAQRVQATLATMAQKYMALPEQIALAWLLALPSDVLPVIGTNNLSRIKEAAQSTDIQLDRQDWFILYHASLGQDVP